MWSGNIAASSVKQDNCQTAVSLSLGSDTTSLPVAYRLYLPKVWAEDAERRKKAGVPEAIVFKTKLEITLDQIRVAHDACLSPGVVLGDTGNAAFAGRVSLAFTAASDNQSAKARLTIPIN